MVGLALTLALFLALLVLALKFVRLRNYARHLERKSERLENYISRLHDEIYAMERKLDLYRRILEEKEGGPEFPWGETLDL